MDLNSFLEYNAHKKGVEETFPFNETTLVLKVMGKMYALTNIHEIPMRINLKCDPNRSIELRENHPEIIPGFHMNKKHWNTIIVGEGNLDQKLIYELIDHSYELVVKSLTKAKREELSQL